MRYSLAAALAATFTSAMAFKDTSPFLMFSTSPMPDSLKDVSRSQLQSKHTVLQTAKDFLKTCPSEIYYILSQPEVSSSEVEASAHHLKMATSNPAVKTRYGVSEVARLETKDADSVARFLEKECGTKVVDGSNGVDVAYKEREGRGSVVVRREMGGVGEGKEEREEALVDHDSTLYNLVLKELTKGYAYTVIYITTPSTNAVAEDRLITYEPEFMEPFHMDLKRNLQTRAESGNATDSRPLFEKYQFLSPGLFMGLLVSFILLSILFVGISAVSSLQVSYGAFDKEMGPAAQKKQQ